MRNLILLSLLLVSGVSFADGYLRLGGMYIMGSEGTEGSLTDSTRTMIDVGAGYVWPKGWTLGGLYGTEKYKYGSSTLDRTSMGPTVGWISTREAGPYILGTYFLKADRSNEMSGKGYQVDLGYKFSIRRISLAPQLSYKYFEYDEVNGASINPKYITKNLDPYFVFWIEF